MTLDLWCSRPCLPIPGVISCKTMLHFTTKLKLNLSRWPLFYNSVTYKGVEITLFLLYVFFVITQVHLLPQKLEIIHGFFPLRVLAMNLGFLLLANTLTLAIYLACIFLNTLLFWGRFHYVLRADLEPIILLSCSTFRVAGVCITPSYTGLLTQVFGFLLNFYINRCK